MAMPEIGVQHKQLQVHIHDTTVQIALIFRGGTGTPIVFLHGWGGSKEDYIDIQYLRHHELRERPFLAYDAPGCGQTICEDLQKVNIGFLAATAEKILNAMNISETHLVGHSMGGLTALQLCRRLHSGLHIRSFVDIKGNLAPEDCFLSRQITQYPDDDPEAFLEAFIARTTVAPLYASALYASVIRQRVQIGAMRGIFESMVELSDHGDLLSAFLDLPCSKVFMYGEQYSGLSYLPKLKAHGVELAEIPQAGHFPMYSNPPAMWDAIARCIGRAEGLSDTRLG